MADSSKLTKKNSIIILVSLVVIAIFLAFLSLLDFDSLFRTEEKKTRITDYGYSFYDADYDTDILKDEEYLMLDRSISYTVGSLTLGGIHISDYSALTVVGKYLDCLIKGDAQRYRKLFTDEFIANDENDIPESFPMQRIYKTHITMIGDEHIFTSDEMDGKLTGVKRYLFKVEYLIQYNTGTVRYDIPSDMSRPIYLEVYESFSGEQKINSMFLNDIPIKKQ